MGPAEHGARRPLGAAEPIGDPAAISTWFPGIVAAEVDGTSRVITTASGLKMPEEIVTNDPVRHVFSYRLTAPVEVPLWTTHPALIPCSGSAGSFPAGWPPRRSRGR